MGDVYQALRSSSPGSRPTGRLPGELYINFADGVFGFVDESGAPVDYVLPEPENPLPADSSGVLLNDGAGNLSWSSVEDLGDPLYLSLGGGVLTGQLHINYGGSTTDYVQLGKNGGGAIESSRDSYPIVTINSAGNGLHVDGTGSSSRLFRLTSYEGEIVLSVSSTGFADFSNGISVGGNITTSGSLTSYNTLEYTRNSGPSYIEIPVDQILNFRIGGVNVARIDEAGEDIPNSYTIMTRQKADARYTQTAVLDALLEELEGSSLITPAQRAAILDSVLEDPPDLEEVE